MIRRPPKSTRTDTLFPYTTLFRSVLMDAGAPATITALSTVMACSTSMIGAIEAAGMINGTSRRLALVGGVESMSRVQIGLGQTLSDWLRQFQKAKSIGAKLSAIAKLPLRSEERSVGKECVSTCRSRWSPDNSKKNTKHKNRTQIKT